MSERTTALIAVQLEISSDILASGDVYRRHIEDAAARAMAGIAADERVIVFPELAGHLALLALGPPAAHKAKTLTAALAASAVRRPLEVLRGIASARVLAPRSAVLAALAPDGEKWWRATFAPLARRHRAYVVAGSHLRLAANGDLTNASLLFAPDGRCLATTDKINLVPGIEDGAPGGLGLARGDRDLPIVETPLGRIATLIGYDACREPRTSEERFDPVPDRLASRGGVDIVANPATRDGLGDSLATLPFARWGVTAQLVGSVLDLHYDGASVIVEPGRVIACAERADRAGHVAATVRANGER
jgi:predicted amidohydrolase